MRPSKIIRVILQDQAREEYETLSRVVEEQKKKGKTNSAWAWPRRKATHTR